MLFEKNENKIKRGQRGSIKKLHAPTYQLLSFTTEFDGQKSFQFQAHDVRNPTLPKRITEAAPSTEHVLHAHADREWAGGPVQGHQREHGSRVHGRPGHGSGRNKVWRRYGKIFYLLLELWPIL